MVRALHGVGVVVVACALALSGCTSGGAGGPTPVPTPAVTPTESPEERQERLDYAAAEKSYRAFRTEYRRVLRAGGTRRPTDVMRATAGGKYLETFTDVTRGYKSLGSRSSGVEEIIYVTGTGYEATSIRLEVCEDARKVTTIKADGSRGKGDLRVANLQVRKSEGVWKVWSGTGKVVKEC